MLEPLSIYGQDDQKVAAAEEPTAPRLVESLQRCELVGGAEAVLGVNIPPRNQEKHYPVFNQTTTWYMAGDEDSAAAGIGRQLASPDSHHRPFSHAQVVVEAFGDRYSRFNQYQAAWAVAQHVLDMTADTDGDVLATASRSTLELEVAHLITQAQPHVPRSPFNSLMQNGCSALVTAVGADQSAGTYIYAAGVGTAQSLVMVELPDGLVVQRLLIPQDRFYFQAEFSGLFVNATMEQKWQIRDAIVRELITTWKYHAPQKMAEYLATIAHSLNDQEKLPNVESTRFNVTRAFPAASRVWLLSGGQGLIHGVGAAKLTKLHHHSHSTAELAQAIQAAASQAELAGAWSLSEVPLVAGSC